MKAPTNTVESSTMPARTRSLSGLVLAIVSLMTCVLGPSLNPGLTQEPPLAATSFHAVDIFVDSGTQPMAAYQLTFAATKGAVKIVGIEGGEHPAFAEPPFYDPDAMQKERAILAAFNTAPATQLPQGKFRVATVHVEVRGTEAPVYSVQLSTAADATGSRINVTTSFSERNKP